MKKVIEINELKNVKRLVFEMPPPGVWLLTGENGAGKTTLLACLNRLGDRNAFPKHFQTSNVSNRLDSYDKSTVSFSINQSKVVYSYSGSRWTPKPKKNASLINGFGYASVLFVGANAERVTPKPEDFTTKRIHPVPQSIKSAANKIFASNKFDALRKVNVTRGQNQAFVFRAGDKYFSEKNFSLGELCTLKLISRIQAAPANSLVVIDELEMALHPSAQVRLYHYLEEVSAQNGHTVIFSTHSVSLIKTADRSKIIFLRRHDDGSTVEERKPYLSAVLGGLAYVEEKSADSVIYVEDEMAEHAARALVRLVSADRLQSGQFSVPKVEVVPIGGFFQVVSFLKRHEALHRSSVKSYALLDRDVKDETIAGWQAQGKVQNLAWFDEYQGRIQFLPWTPEVGIVEQFLQPGSALLASTREKLGEVQLHFHTNASTVNDPSNRNECKEWVNDAVEFWSEHYGVDCAKSREALCSSLAALYFAGNRPAAMQLISPLIS